MSIDGFFTGLIHFYDKDYDDLKLENEELKKDIELYKNYKNQNEELNNEINKLKEVVKINKLLSDSVYVNASVINRDFDFWHEKLMINVGLNDGITNHMAVVSNGTLIGITDDVSSNNSSVILLCNNKFPVNISVKIDIGDHYVYGILNSYNSLSNSFSVIGVVDNVEIPADSLVVTTGLGNIFPSGILIGSVDSVLTDNFDLSKVIMVKSNTNFDDISYVTVVKRDEK